MCKVILVIRKLHLKETNAVEKPLQHDACMCPFHLVKVLQNRVFEQALIIICKKFSGRQ